MLGEVALDLYIPYVGGAYTQSLYLLLLHKGLVMPREILGPLVFREATKTARDQ